MPDIMSKAQRSRHMGLVRNRNTRFELAFLRLVSAELYPLGYRYRKHCYGVFGTPDIVFHRFKLAIFIDSDFWHGRNYKLLADRMNLFWRKKIERNMERDRQVARKLRRQGWSVLRFGERQIKRRPLDAIARIKRKLRERS
jgi:DNA mismatch endonuclease, patch repair protein